MTQNIVKIFIILIFVFILLPIILQLFGFKTHEPFENWTTNGNIRWSGANQTAPSNTPPIGPVTIENEDYYYGSEKNNYTTCDTCNIKIDDTYFPIEQFPMFIKDTLYNNIHMLDASMTSLQKELETTKQKYINEVSSCDASMNFLKQDLANKKPEPAPIKCLADFGTDVGDALCCGQKGVLQNTKYVCPNTLSKCSNFKCGSAFGTCVAPY